MENKSFSFPMIGASSLLTIFAVLCLVVFAILSVSTVQSQRNLSLASASAVSGYYTADAQAESILAQLRAGSIPIGVTKEHNQYTYSCPISPTHVLEVEVTLAGTDYVIQRWQAVPSAPWTSSNELNVWSGG